MQRVDEETLKFISSNPPPKEEASFHRDLSLNDAMRSPDELAREVAEVAKFRAQVDKPDWPISLILATGGFAILLLFAVCFGSCFV